MISRPSLAAAPAPPAAPPAAPARTNLVVFMTDDHGAWAMGAYGCRDFSTPHLDRLAEEGVRFTHAYAATPVCSPSRMTYMTGALPSRHGVQDWLRPADSFGARSRRWLAGFFTWPEALERAGYRLGMTGKWHMGQDDQAQSGFTYWATVPGGGGTYRDPEFVRNGVRAKIPGFKTDIVGDCALEFLDQQKPGQPFALYVPFYAPHTPYDYQPEVYRRPYSSSAFRCFPDTAPHPWRSSELAGIDGQREARLGYSALVTAADANAGRILKRLEERGLREGTLVIFTASQGWNAGHHGIWGKGNGTWPFNLYEESIRVPMIWNHPGRLRPAVVDALVSAYDFFPTLLDYLNVPAPPDPRRVGRSYAAFLRGQKPPAWPNRLYFEYAHVRGVRTGNLKYVERTQEWPSQMFDLAADPGETRDLIDDLNHRAQREALRQDLRRFFQAAGAPPLEDWRTTTRQELTVYRRGAAPAGAQK